MEKMAFIDNLGKKLGSALEITAEKTKELTEATRLNMQISAEERKREKLYMEIGKLVFEKEKNKGDSFVSKQCKDISELTKGIDQLSEQLKEHKKD